MNITGYHTPNDQWNRSPYDDKRHMILRDIAWYCNITRNHQVFSLLRNGDIDDVKLTVGWSYFHFVPTTLCLFVQLSVCQRKAGWKRGFTRNALKRIGLDGVKPVKPKSDGSESEVNVQFHLQKQDCQLLAASETDNRLLKWNLANLALAKLL